MVNYWIAILGVFLLLTLIAIKSDFNTILYLVIFWFVLIYSISIYHRFKTGKVGNFISKSFKNIYSLKMSDIKNLKFLEKGEKIIDSEYYIPVLFSFFITFSISPHSVILTNKRIILPISVMGKETLKVKVSFNFGKRKTFTSVPIKKFYIEKTTLKHKILLGILYPILNKPMSEKHLRIELESQTSIISVLGLFSPTIRIYSNKATKWGNYIKRQLKNLN